MKAVAALALLAVLGQVRTTGISPKVTRVAERFSWKGSGGSWAVPPEAPTPIVHLTNYGGGNWTCTGVACTCVKNGASASVTSPYRPDGTTILNAAAFNGTNDWFNCGDIADAASVPLTIAVAFRPANASFSGEIVAKDATSQRAYSLSLYAGVLKTFIFKNLGTGNTNYTIGTTTANTWNFGAFRYRPVADGTSVLDGNLNGAASTTFSVAVAPILNSTAALYIGSREAPASRFVGDVAVVTIWLWDATVANLARLGRGFQVRQGTFGLPVTFTRAASQTIERDGKVYAMPAANPAIGAAGNEVYPAYWQYATNSSALELWTPVGTPVVTPDTWTMANGGLGETIEDDDAAASEGVTVNGGGTLTGNWTFSCRMKAGTLSAVRLRIVTDGTGTADCAKTLTSTDVRYSCSVLVGGSPTYVSGQALTSTTVTDVGTFYAGACNLTPTVSAAPNVAAGASAVSQPATVVTLGSILGTAARPFCVKFIGTAPWGNGLGANVGLWNMNGASANSIRSYATPTGAVWFYTNDGTGAYKYWYSADSLLVAGARHTIHQCYSPAPAVSMAVDGVALSLSVNGAGTGVLASYASIEAERVSTAALNGSMEELVFCANTTNWRDCQ